MESCELCAFQNPKATVTAVIIRDNNVLLLKRAENPFKGWPDFPGGYMHAGAMPEDELQRELQEELGVSAHLSELRAFPGTASWKDRQFPILSLCYLADIGEQKITLNEENTEQVWVPLGELDPKTIAFDSNQKLAAFIKEKFTFDIGRVRELVGQLDQNAVVKEQSLYRAMLNGFVSVHYDHGTLVGMGWIFPRQTLLRKQAVVEDMIVDESQRGKGLGRKILQDLVDWAKQHGCEVIELTTNPKRVAAHALYEKFGFRLHPTDHMLLDL